MNGNGITVRNIIERLLFAVSAADESVAAAGDHLLPSPSLFVLLLYTDDRPSRQANPTNQFGRHGLPTGIDG